MTVDADEADAAAEAAAAAARRRALEAAAAATKAEREAAAADAAISKRLHAVSAAAGARADAAAAKARAVAAAEAAERAEAEARRRRDEEEAQQQQRRKQAEEEEARRKREAEEEARRKDEQAAKAAAEAAAGAKAQAQAQAAAAAAAAKAALPRPVVIASPSATAWAEKTAAALAAARSSAAPFMADASPAAKTRRRTVDRAITLAVQQISATTSQVDAKARQIAQLLTSLDPQSGERSYGFLAFAARVVAQCECQVALSPAFAFPLAQVVAAVCSGVAGVPVTQGGEQGEISLLDVVAGRLHAATPLAVPSWVRASAEGHHEKVGYRAKSENSSELESTDDFAARLRGYALFLGALVAAADAGRWGGQGQQQQQQLQGQQAATATTAAAARARGWSFVASALNALPPNRLTAVVLDGFLDAGGHALYGAYGRQFLKLLAALDEFFLPGLEAKKNEGGKGDSNSADADAARPAAARLRSYLHGGAFRDPPEGSVLPESDASSYDRA